MNARPLVVLTAVVLILGACSDADDERLSGRDATFGADGSSADGADAADGGEGGEACRVEKDSDGDGLVDDVFHYDYDADGVLLSVTGEHFDDRTSVRTFEYDSQGRLLGSETDVDSDGVIDSRMSVTYEPRADGGYFGTRDTDHGVDGTVDLRGVYEYDAQERLLSYEQDRDMDGATDFATVYTYNADGRLATIRTDFEGDGEFEGLFSYIYEDGVLVRRHTDHDGDGHIDWDSRYFYEDGQLVRLETEGEAGSQMRTYTTEYFYDC